jgi:hypothetical protein
LSTYHLNIVQNGAKKQYGFLMPTVAGLALVKIRTLSIRVRKDIHMLWKTLTKMEIASKIILFLSCLFGKSTRIASSGLINILRIT